MAEKIVNTMKIQFTARSINEAFARSAVAAFAAQCDPSIAAIADIKTAVSEAVTNAIVHGYAGREDRDSCFVYISCRLDAKSRIYIQIRDRGCGIPDIEAALQPLYTTDTEGERSGMGFTVMESFCDRLKVNSAIGKGTTVRLEKRLITR